MPIVLRKMTEETYGAYMREHEEEYARDRMITDRETFEEALRTTRAQQQSMLPQGLNTPDHSFCTVDDEQLGQSVGYAWFAYRPRSRELFLYHILIKPSERRKGYGTQALAAIAVRAKELGCRAVWLNVMAHNQGAIDFYLAQGYRVAATHMNKHLDPD